MGVVSVSVNMKWLLLLLGLLFVTGPLVSAWGSDDSDGDGVSDADDEDDDNDGLLDNEDEDDYGDGIPDDEEDFDGDGLTNEEDGDEDDDNDGIENDEDPNIDRQRVLRSTCIAQH